MLKKYTNFASANLKGEVLEWLKRHAWKACNRQNRFAGSNPVLSAMLRLSVVYEVFTQHYTPKVVLGELFSLYFL